jgi:hypothetical protein
MIRSHPFSVAIKVMVVAPLSARGMYTMRYGASRTTFDLNKILRSSAFISRGATPY